MRTTAREDLECELHDPEFRKLYGTAEAKSELAVAIADARHGLGLTQEEMSKKAGVSQPYIAKLESGEANPTVGAIGSMLAILNLRLTMETASLLPKPISFDAIFGYKPAADTSEIVIMATPMATYPAGERRQQGTLFPIGNYNSFAPLDEADELSAVATRSRSFEEANVGGQRV